MELQDFLDHVNAGRTIEAASEYMMFSGMMSQEALKLTMDLNNRYHTPEEVQEIFSKLTG